MMRSVPERIIEKLHSRRGATVVLAAFLLVVVFAMVAFAVDIGYIVHVDTELQRTADACAMAAARNLPNQGNAIAAAQSLANKNKGSEGPSLTAGDIVFGIWDRDTATFTPTTVGPNAVKVTVERSTEKGNPLKLFFAPIIGRNTTKVTATAIAMMDNNLCGPLIGIDWIMVPGDPTSDSFRSSDGSYASQTPRDNGNFCSDGWIYLTGNPIANGDANPGRGHNTTLDGGAIVTGNMSPRLRPLNLPDVDASNYEVNNDNDSLPGIQKGNNLISPIDANGNFLLDGGKTYEMPPGTYYVNDLTLTGQSTLKVSGPTTIYVTGNVDTSGGYMINNTQIASNLRIYIEGGENSTAVVTSAVDLYAVVYAPKTAVQLQGSADFFGAVVGQSLYVTGTSDIHYDEDLAIDDALNLPKRVSLVK